MKVYCVISHTHWDREWYQTQEQFRLRLIDLLDNLMDILDENENYIFHMDAQTIVMEDYWELYPERKEQCCRYIREGRLLIGPWYVQNDFFLTSGEATIRNLLIGMKQAREYGKCSMTGYMPDQFGLPSQMPQIFANFGIDHCIFGRGRHIVYLDENGERQVQDAPCEFIWRSPDGTQMLAICMNDWYNNAQRFSADINKAMLLLQSIAERMEKNAGTPYLLLMNGVDHLEAQEDLLPIIEQMNLRLPQGEQIIQTTMEEYVRNVRQQLQIDELTVHMGELTQGSNYTLLRDTASSRIYLKMQNLQLQNMLENQLEPLYTILQLLGTKGQYPSGHLDYLWKMLIRNHAHDSICGCSKDAVHRHMEDRFAAIGEMGEALVRRGMLRLAEHIAADMDQKDYMIVVFNGLERPRGGIIETTVDIVLNEATDGLQIIDSQGKEVAYELLKQETVSKGVFAAINLPGFVEIQRYHIRMLVDEVPPYGYTAYRVVPTAPTTALAEKKLLSAGDDGTYCLENQHLKAVVASDGTISLQHKKSGHTFNDLLSVCDVADIGDSYMHFPMPGDVPIVLSDFKPKILVEETGCLRGQLRLHYELLLPECYDSSTKKRSEQLVAMPFDIILALEADEQQLRIRFSFENKVKDHLLRAVIRTGCNTDDSEALVPFDMVSRNKWRNDTSYVNESEHNSGVVTLRDKEIALSVLNFGIYSYEHLQNEDGTLTFALVRSTGRINIEGVGAPEDDSWEAPENQCLRQLCCDLAILPCSADPAFAAKCFQNPLLVQSEAADMRKFAGGRTAVQSSEIAELFYRPLPATAVHLPMQIGGFRLRGEGLLATALKQSCDRKAWVFRFFNTGDALVHATLELNDLPVAQVWKADLQEQAKLQLPICDGSISIDAGPKEIVTLKLCVE